MDINFIRINLLELLLIRGFYLIYIKTIINKIKKKERMKRELSYLDNLNNFSLVRYEPKDIILLNKNTRQPYRYHELN